MKMWRRVFPEEIDRWKDCAKEGLSARAIGVRFNRSHKTILKYIDVPKENSKSITRKSVELSKLSEEQRRDRNRRKKNLAKKKRCHLKLPARLGSIFHAAKRRAKKKELCFSISIEDLFSLYEAQEGKCSVTGMSFVFEAPPKDWKNHPYSLSLDRIDASKGYEKENLRFVLTAVNLAFSEWGDQVFQTIVRAYLEKNKQA